MGVGKSREDRACCRDLRRGRQSWAMAGTWRCAVGDDKARGDAARRSGLRRGRTPWGGGDAREDVSCYPGLGRGRTPACQCVTGLEPGGDTLSLGVACCRKAPRVLDGARHRGELLGSREGNHEVKNWEEDGGDPEPPWQASHVEPGGQVGAV